MKTTKTKATSETTHSVIKAKTDRVAKNVVQQDAKSPGGIKRRAKSGGIKLNVKKAETPTLHSKLSIGPVTINGRVYDESDFQRMAAEATSEPTAEQVAGLLARQASGENHRGRPALQGGSVPARTRIGKDLDRRLDERAALEGIKKAAAMRDAIDRGLSV